MTVMILCQQRWSATEYCMQMFTSYFVNSALFVSSFHHQKNCDLKKFGIPSFMFVMIVTKEQN